MGASWQMWQLFYGITGVIKNIDVNDLSVPDLEIRNYLTRHYNSRFQVNPRKFENLVSSVFKDLGFQALCTPYSHDGGIDILLEKGSDLSAVQVKRTKNAIKLEQVRSFLGALTLQGIQNGIYVSTSEFQRGCYDIANSCSINLFGGSRFYEILLEAQILRYSNMAFPNLRSESLYHCGCFELNSL
ncbi:restriction endonuclease [Pedobacter sp. BG31]|uniref:restriction endonuclease n=1 Tax=Pedobacter sp. BG31 TaxID=3349697 RepID=UPI003670354A